MNPVKKPKVSVIIPTFNNGSAITDTVKSIENNNYENLEIVIVNDGSTDETAEICAVLSETYGNIVCIHQENSGVSAARNTGLNALTDSDYYMFVDADDVITETAVKTLVDAAISTDADITVGKVCEQRADMQLQPQISTGHTATIADKKEILYKTLDAEYETSCAKLYKYSAFSDVRFAVGKKINEDVYYVFECLLKAHCVVETNTEVYIYLYHENSSSHAAFSEKFYDMIYFRDRMLKEINETFPEYENLAKAVYLRRSIAFLNKMSSCNSGYDKAELKKARADVVKNRKSAMCLTKKEKIRLMLITYLFPVYLAYMRRNLKK